MINDYKEVKECVYKNERYTVRDNGAIFRHKRDGKKLRIDDERWTFGIKNSKTGYMLLGDHRVHIIVATAFFGERDSKKFIVDHIDTNRCNNRVENLRWLTRLENVLNNDITRNKIIALCGSIEAFIENPRILREHIIGTSSLAWMRTVSAEEAKIAYENNKKYWEAQASNPQPFAGGTLNGNIYKRQNTIQTNSTESNSGHNQIKGDTHSLTKEQVRELINPLKRKSEKQNTGTNSKIFDYKPSEKEWTNAQSLSQGEEVINEELNNLPNDSDIIKAKSPSTALQKNWAVPACFFNCPVLIESNPLEQYYDRLTIDRDFFSYKFSNSFVTELIIDKAYSCDNKSIIVLSCSNKQIRISQIYLYNNYFVHENLGIYEKYQVDDALEHFIKQQGLSCSIQEYKFKIRFEESNLIKAKSPETAWQIKWKTPTDFMCCPTSIEGDPIQDYYDRLVIGKDYNSTTFYGGDVSVQQVLDKAYIKEDNTIIVLSINASPGCIKPYALSKIYYFDGKFIHESLSTFFEEDGGRKYFILHQGLEWTRGDVFDDFC